MDRSSHVFVRDIPDGACVNGVLMRTTEGAAQSGYHHACTGFEAGSTSCTGEPSRKGGARAYFKLRRNRGDVKFFPVRDDSGEVVGFEVAASGDDAVLSLTSAITAVGEILRNDL